MGAPSRIEKGVKVTMAYTLRDGAGAEVDRAPTEHPIVFVFGYGILVPGLERELEGLTVGSTKTVRVAPEDGFGVRDDELVFEIDRGDLPKTLTAGETFVAEDEEGVQESLKVLEVHDDFVVVDANHPLAGVTLHYEVTVLALAEATARELREAEDRVPLDDASFDHESGPLLIPEARRSQPPGPLDN